MKAQKFDANGKKSGEVSLPAALFEGEISRGAIHAVIRAENANRRQGTHKTKGFSEVSGGGKKPWRQKGTGNARQGSIRAPQWRKGATVFGPQPRDYTIPIPEKMRRTGLRSIFALKAKKNVLHVIDPLKLEKFSTKKMYELFETMGLLPNNTVVFVSDDDDFKVRKSLMNIPEVEFVHAKRLTAPELHFATHMVVAESALPYLAEKYGATKKQGKGAA